MKKQYFVILGVIIIILIVSIIFLINLESNKIKPSLEITHEENLESNKIKPSSEITYEELNSLTEAQCKQNGYEWFGFRGICISNERGEYDDCGGSKCDIPTKDAGKKCYSNNECEGACLCSKNEKDSEGFQIGECSRYKYFSEVIDCACILKTKSKNPNFPYGCA